MFSRFSRFRIRALGARRRRFAAADHSPINLKKWVIGGVIGLVAAIVLRKTVVLVVFSILAFLLTPILPSIDDQDALLANQSTVIYDRDGNELYTIHGDENRFDIPFSKMPESVKLATIASEDDNFYNHPGIDVDGIIRAVLGELGLPFAGGGSTITQQFVKNAYLSPERSYLRKAKEWLLAVKLENNFEKDEILEMYLNRIPYGNNAYGIQAAAETYFAKNAEDLTLAESVVLAGLPQAPSRYSPYGANRDLLMGSCQTGGEQLDRLPEQMTLSLTATGTVWLRVTTDGVRAKEWTMKTGETITFPFTKDFAIIHGNGNLTLTVDGVTIAVPAVTRTTTTKADRAQLEQLANEQGVTSVSLAGSCTGPTDPSYTPGRKDYVLGRMLHLGFITQAEYDAAWTEAMQLTFKPYREPIKHPHFVFYVRDWLEQAYGKDIVERGGLRVFTTVDSSLQTKAEELITGAFPHTTDPTTGETTWQPNYANATNGSLLSIDNTTGQILAMVGSRDYFEHPAADGSGNDGATNLAVRPRQPGSSFKPFAYTAGFLRGFAPGSVLWDVQTNFGGQYEPKNFDGSQWGPTSIRRALQGSRNIPAVKMAVLVGDDAIASLVRKLGLTSVHMQGNYGPAIALGVAEVPMTEMVRGYSVFANGGKLVTLTPILKVTDSRGNLIEEFTPELDTPQVLDPQAAYLTTSILTDKNSRPASWNRFITLADRPSGAKTGTANRRYGTGKNDVLPGDIWTIGFTPQITTAVWFGNNDNSAMNIRGEGLTIPGPIWRDFMTYAHRDLPALDFARPEGIVEKSVSRLTGKLPSSRTPIDQITTDLFASWNVPIEVDDAFITVEVDKVSGKLPTAYTPPAAIEKRTFANIHSERPSDPYFEKPVRAWVGAMATSATAGGSAIVYGPPPTEYDDVHTSDSSTRPSVSIVSPGSGSTTRTGGIGVWVDAASVNGIARVEYFRDGELISTATASPWKGAITIPARAPAGSRVTITAKAYDTLGYSDTSSVEVIIGEDTQAPTVQITTPAAGQEIAHGTPLLVTAQAFDHGGDVSRVRFELDGNRIAEATTTPYQTTISDAALGSHTLRAIVTDTAGLESAAETLFTVIKKGATVSAPSPATAETTITSETAVTP